MKPEKPAMGILKTGDFGPYKSYQVQCECHSPECSHHVYVEADSMEVTVTIDLTMRSKWYSMNRWKQIWSILTKGYVDTETTLVMHEQTALNYAETLRTAIKDVKSFRND